MKTPAHTNTTPMASAIAAAQEAAGDDLEEVGAEIALILNSAVPDHLSEHAVACGLLTYLVALARTAPPAQRHRIAVMTTNAAAELAGVALPRT